MYDDEAKQFFECEEYMETALSLSLTGKNEEAIKIIDKAIAINPNFAQAYNKKGDFLFKLGRIKEALDCYLKSKELNPEIQNNYYDLGRTYLLLGDYDNSLANFQHAYEMKPQEDIHAFIGKIYFDQNMLEEAKTSFENILIKQVSNKKNATENELNMGSSNTMAVYYYAQVLLKLGNTSEANMYFDRIIEKFTMISKNKKNAAEAHYYIGKAQFFKGNFEEAVKNLKLAVEYDTDKIYNHYSFDMFYSDAEAFAALAEAQNQLGQTSEAKENILKAISLEPENKKLLEIKMKMGY